MLAGFLRKHKIPMEQRTDCFFQKFPLISGICMQLAAAVFMICAVGVIALIGGSVIWMFYRMLGVM